MYSFVLNDSHQARILGRNYCPQKKAKKTKTKTKWTSRKIKLLVWAKLSNNSIPTDKGTNLFPKNLPGHRIISWKSEDESHVIENFVCNSTSWKLSAKSWVYKGLFVSRWVWNTLLKRKISFSNDLLLLELNIHSQRFVKKWLVVFLACFREKTRSF